MFAMGAQATDQALGHDCVHRRRDQKWLHTDIDKTRDRRRRVVGVQSTEHEVAGQAGVGGNRRRLQIANLADHDDIRGLTKNGAQRDRKRHSYFIAYLHLIDPSHLILDRFFHRNDFAVGLVDVIETGVEGAGLPRTGRAGYEQNSIGRTQQPSEFFLIVAEEAEFRQTEKQTRLVKHAHDDAFAMIGRDGGNAQINRFLFDLHLNAPVLRQTLFRYAHRTGHDFEPADDGRLQTLRRRLHFLENAVDAKTDTEFFVERLEMNVAGTKLVCLDDQHRN